MSEAEARAFLTGMSEAPMFTPGQWLQIGIAEPTADRLIGDIGIFLSDDGRTSEMGFTLEPAAQGRGIATAAVREALGLVFANTHVQRVMGITDSRNVASIRLLERVGFRYETSRTTTFRGEPCLEKVFVLPRDGDHPGISNSIRSS